MKYETNITRCNDGNHSPAQTKLAWEWIERISSTYKAPRLYHLCFTQAEYPAHKALLKDLSQRMRRKLIPCCWRAAREIDNIRGDHLHVYLACDAIAFNSCSVINRNKDGWLSRYAKKRGIRVFINAPADPMHNANNYMSLPPSKPEKIQDAKLWISYLYKHRSKPQEGNVYSNSKRIVNPESKVACVKRNKIGEYTGHPLVGKTKILKPLASLR